MYGLSYDPSPLPVSAAPLEGAASVVVVGAAVAATESDLGAFFFLADFDSGLLAGFWVVEVAIVMVQG